MGVCQSRQWYFLCGIVEQHHAERIPRKLCSDQVSQGERNTFGGCESVLAVKDHGVRAVEHEDRGGAGSIFRLVHHEIRVIDIDRKFEPPAFDGLGEGGADVEIERIAVFVWLRSGPCLYTRGQVCGVVASETRLADATE